MYRLLQADKVCWVLVQVSKLPFNNLTSLGFVIHEFDQRL